MAGATLRYLSPATTFRSSSKVAVHYAHSAKLISPMHLVQLARLDQLAQQGRGSMTFRLGQKCELQVGTLESAVQVPAT